MFLGDDLLPFMVLAFGGAMVVGSVAALLRPPTKRRDDQTLERPSVTRSVGFIVVGLVCAVWALASLVTG